MKSFKSAIVFIELIITIIVFFHFYSYNYEICYSTTDLNYSETDNGLRIRTPKNPLKRGLYNIYFEYSGNHSDELFGNIQLRSASKEMNSKILCDDVGITNYQNKYNIRAHVKANNIPARISLRIHDNDIAIVSLKLVYNRLTTAIYYSFCMLVIIIVINLILFYLPGKLRTFTKEQFIVAAAIIITSVLASIPLYRNELSDGHDITFHLTRIASIADGIRSLQIPVRLESLWANEYGYAASICYGGLLLYIPAILFLIGFSLCTAYKIFLVIVTIFTCLSSYICFKGIGKGNYKIGIVSMILYTFSLYRLVDVYTRAAAGEYCALAFIPFILYGTYSLLNESVSEKEIITCYVVGFTGLINTHILTTLMVTIFLTIFSVCYIVKIFNKRNISALFKSAGITLLLNLWFIIPFIDYYITVPMLINTSEPRQIKQEGIYLSQIFQWAGNPIGGSEPASKSLSEMPLGLGISLVIILIASTLVIFVFSHKLHLRKLFPMLAITYLSAFMSTIYFPYDKLSTQAPLMYKFIGAVQFPWRYVAITTALTVSLFAYLFSDSTFLPETLKPYVYQLLIGITLTQGLWYIAGFYHNASGYPNNDYNSVNRYHYFIEYQLAGTDKEKTKAFPKTISTDESLTIINESRNAYHFELDVKNEADKIIPLIFPVWNYKGMRASCNYGKLETYTYQDNNQLAVLVPADYSGEISVNIEELWYWRLSELISLITLIAIIILSIPHKLSGAHYH